MLHFKYFESQITKPSYIYNGLDNIPLQNIEVMKDLGIIISENLKWQNHINYIYNKAALSSYQILKSFNSKNIWILKKTSSHIPVP